MCRDALASQRERGAHVLQLGVGVSQHPAMVGPEGRVYDLADAWCRGNLVYCHSDDVNPCQFTVREHHGAVAIQSRLDGVPVFAPANQVYVAGYETPQASLGLWINR